jgi:hypothetical protein
MRVSFAMRVVQHDGQRHASILQRLVLEIDIRKLLPGAVRHDEEGVYFLDVQGGGKAASSKTWP